jgi:hypothetical protein
MRLVVMLDCLQPVHLAWFLVTALACRLAPQAGAIGCAGPRRPAAPDLVGQRVPEPKAGPNRMHLDLRIPPWNPNSRGWRPGRRTPHA